MPKPKRVHSRRIPFLISGFLTILAFPPIGFWPLAWVALIPLITKSRSLTFGAAFRRGWWAGLVVNAGLLYWVGLNTGTTWPIALASFFGLILILPLYWALFAALWAFLWRRWGDLAALLLPAIWVALEVVKNAPEIGFPWLEMGLTQIGFLPVAQIAEWGGIRLVSGWVVAANVAFFFFLNRQTRVFFYLAVPLILSMIWGAWRMNHLPEPGPAIRAVIVQGNVDPALKWRQDPDSSVVLYEEMTREAVAAADADLVIWPETAVPVYLAYQERYHRRIRNLTKEVGAAILTGASHYEFSRHAGSGHDRFNSAFFFPADGAVPQRYDKIRLVPFGERVPFQGWFPKLGELNFGQAEFTPGKEYSVFGLENGPKISAQICFESVFGLETNRFVQHGSRVICNLTNDGWYRRSSGPYQHADLVRFKCIETRCPLLRAANTGVSLTADRSGRVLDYLPLMERGWLHVEVDSGGPQLTFYVKLGELIPRILALLGLLAVLLSIFKRPLKGR